jgi:hypothetical protein
MSETVSALAALHAGILSGERLGRRATWSRVVDGEDVVAIRGLLEAGSGAVTRDEADILFDIADAVAFAGNDPEWDDLFIGAVAHHLVGASGHSVRARPGALHASAGLKTHVIAAAARDWLIARVRRDGRVTEAERVLLAFAGADAEAGRASLAAVTLAA